jgi:hypothetical protein
MPYAACVTLAAVALLAGAACAATTSPDVPDTERAPLLAKGGGGQRKVTICHVGDDGTYVMISPAAPGAANHLAKHARDIPATLTGGTYTCPARPAG